jgi:hypothetical protein
MQVTEAEAEDKRRSDDDRRSTDQRRRSVCGLFAVRTKQDPSDRRQLERRGARSFFMFWVRRST